VGKKATEESLVLFKHHNGRFFGVEICKQEGEKKIGSIFYAPHLTFYFSTGKKNQPNLFTHDGAKVSKKKKKRLPHFATVMNFFTLL
jgi:hypothetical protein